MSKRNPLKVITQAQQIKKLSQELVTANNRTTSLREQLRKVDEAVFECIMKTELHHLGRVTDAVMERVRRYSSALGDKISGELAPAHKRKARR